MIEGESMSLRRADAAPDLIPNRTSVRPEHKETLMADRVDESLPDLLPGSVWLVGAGPGDPGLLSWLAVKAMRTADTVLHDAAIEPALLEAARSGPAFLQPVPDDPAAREEALRRCIKLAREGWRVVRLVEGDPLARRSGVESALALGEAGVPFRIVPGITAAIGGLSYAGVPVTQRGVNSAVCFLDVSGDEAGVPLAAEVARLVPSIPVVIVGIRPAAVAEVARALLAAGVAESERVLLVARATSERQETVETDLGGCAGGIGLWPAERKLVMAIGRIVELRRRLAWRDQAPPPAPVPLVASSLAGLAG
jgi:uroporphyrin-III C-methyltransferase